MDDKKKNQEIMDINIKEIAGKMVATVTFNGSPAEIGCCCCCSCCPRINSPGKD